MEYSLYHKNTQLEDILHLMKPDSLVVGDSKPGEGSEEQTPFAWSGIRKGNERRINKEFLEEDYKKCGYRMSAAKVGQIMKTEDHHMYTCHLDGEPLTIYYFEAEKRAELLC